MEGYFRSAVNVKFSELQRAAEPDGVQRCFNVLVDELQQMADKGDLSLSFLPLSRRRSVTSLEPRV